MSIVGGVLVRAENWGLRLSYACGQRIEKSSNPLAARLYALPIPLICGINEAIKVTTEGSRILRAGRRSIQERRLLPGNVQAGLMHTTEHLRNMVGVVAGALLGCCCPRKAQRSFLVGEAKEIKGELTSDQAAQLYALGYFVDHFFTQHSIDYRICSGTQLGAARHQGVIPWDTNIDLFLHPFVTRKVRMLVENGSFTRETGLKLIWEQALRGWRCFFSEAGPVLNIFCTERHPIRGRLAYISPAMSAVSTGDFFLLRSGATPL